MALEAITGHGHFHAGLVKFVSAFWGKPRAAALAQAMINRVQTIEDVLWTIFPAYHIDTADDTRLAVLGRIVGQRREQVWDTETYRAIIRGKIRANQSRGLTDDIIEVLLLVTQTTEEVAVEHLAPATALVVLTEQELEFEMGAVEFLLPRTRSAGVQLHFYWSEEPDAVMWGEGFWETDLEGWNVKIL